MNLLALLKENLNPEMMTKIGNLVGEDTGKTTTAMSAILPTIMGSLVGKASTNEGASDIMSMLSSGTHDGGIMNNLGSVFNGGSTTEGMMSKGATILFSLLGDKMGSIVNVISNFAGIKNDSANSLMSLAAPMIMGVIGKQVSGENMSANGLMNLLSGQKNHVVDALPAGLGDKLGSILGLGSIFGGASSMVSGMTNDSSKTATNYARNDEENNSNVLPKWLLPLLISAAVIAGLLYFMKGCDKTSESASTTTDSLSNGMATSMDSMAISANSVVSSAANVTKKLFKLRLPDGSEMEVPEGSLEDQIVKFIQDDSQKVDKKTWFNFDRLLFDTGKSTLKAESQEQIDKTIAILKAFPKVKIKIGGYTDNVGDAKSNMELSTERALVVMNAIVDGGIDKNRLQSEGYGDKNPVATNETEDGRMLNRRIAISVREK